MSIGRLTAPYATAAALVAIAGGAGEMFLSGRPAIIVLGITAAVEAGVVAAMAIAVRRKWLLPLRDLGGSAAQLAAGHWSMVATPEGAGDIRYLADKLNAAAAQARRQLAELQGQRADLQALVDTLPDPVLLLDARRQIVLVNSAASRLIGTPARDLIGQPMTHALTDPALRQAFDEAAAAGADAMLQRELKLVAKDGRRLTFQAVAARTSAGLLLALRDITTLSDTMQMKTDFVANASHELRTPIAAMKVAIETLEDVFSEDPQQARKCIRIVDGHVRRLEELLRDLLDLSRLESAENPVAKARVTAENLFSVLRSTFSSAAAEKGLALDLIASPGTEWQSDERVLHLVLKNLVENAIKFTQTGSVRVIIEKSEGRTKIVVADTGVGISPEHLHRVFERFYQIDPARSGSAGRGTGLGLSIVKHAMHTLGGIVTLESTPNQGTIITCSIPA